MSRCDDESDASSELAAAERASTARPSGTVMREEMPEAYAGKSPDDEPDGAAILAEAGELTMLMIEAGRSRAHDEIARLPEQLDSLFVELEDRLAAAPCMLQERMDALIADARAQTSQVEVAAHAGVPSWLDALDARVTTSVASSQQTVADLFDDTMIKYRIVDTAEAISERCIAGDCFERDVTGELLRDEAGNLIPNITEGEYMLLFDAAEIQTGVPAELLMALAHDEVNTAVYRMPCRATSTTAAPCTTAPGRPGELRA